MSGMTREDCEKFRAMETPLSLFILLIGEINRSLPVQFFRPKLIDRPVVIAQSQEGGNKGRSRMWRPAGRDTDRTVISVSRAANGPRTLYSSAVIERV